MSRKLQKQDPHTQKIKETLEEFNLPAVDQVEVTNQFTGKTSIVTIDRTGTTEEKVIRALANSETPQEQKDAAISMYLFERGKENASFLADLYTFKGKHTKETRKFKTEVRFDLTMMANALAVFLDDTSTQIEEDLANDMDRALSHFAERCKSMSKTLVDLINKTTEDRMRETGYGIYVSKEGKPYSVFDDDFDKAVARDKEFQECDECKSKPGTPTLCDECVNKRNKFYENRS